MYFPSFGHLVSDRDTLKWAIQKCFYNISPKLTEVIKVKWTLLYYWIPDLAGTIADFSKEGGAGLVETLLYLPQTSLRLWGIQQDCIEIIWFCFIFYKCCVSFVYSQRTLQLDKRNTVQCWKSWYTAARLDEYCSVLEKLVHCS